MVVSKLVVLAQRSVTRLKLCVLCGLTTTWFFPIKEEIQGECKVSKDKVWQVGTGDKVGRATESIYPILYLPSGGSAEPDFDQLDLSV